MSYTSAKSKPNKDLVSYQSVRGADVKTLYEAVVESTPMTQLYSDFVRPRSDGSDVSRDAVNNTIRFLIATDFLEKPSDDVVERIPGQPYEEQPFELRMLHHLQQQTGEQNHFMELHRFIGESSRVHFDRSALVEELNRELDSYAFEWNKEKVKMWYDFVSPLGLTSVNNSQEILTAPSPRIVYDGLELFNETKDSTRLRDALDWVENEFFYCYAERGGALPRVHAGLSETLGTLEYHDVISFHSTSDATREVAIPSITADKTSSFELHPLSQRPAFEYPLNSHEVTITK